MVLLSGARDQKLGFVFSKDVEDDPDPDMFDRCLENDVYIVKWRALPY